MLRRTILSTFVLLFPTTLPSSTAPAPDAGGATPTLVVRVQPIDRLLDDVRYLAKKFGHIEDPKELEAKMLEMLGLDNLAATGIDTKKPIGAYVFIAADVTESTAVGMLPVADEKTLLAMVGKYEVKADKIEDNFYSLAIPDMPLPMFVRFANGYAYVTALHKEALAIEKLLPPARIFAGNETATLAATLMADQIPDAARKMALDWIAENIKEAAEHEDNDVAKSQIAVYQKWTEMFAQDSKESTLKVNFERASGELAFAFNVTPKQGTKLATEVAAIKPGQSLFTKLVGAAGAINLAVNSHVDAEITKVAVKLFQDANDDLFSMFNIEIEDEKTKEEVRKLFRALVPSLETGSLDGAVTMRGPGAKHYTGLMGLKLKDGKKIEEQIRKLVDVLPKEQRDRFKLDKEKVAGFAVHSFNQGDDNEYFKKIFGDETVFFAIRDDAIVVGVGENSAKAVGETLAALSPLPAPAVQFDVTAGKLKPFFDTFDENTYTIVRQVLGTDDRLRLYHVTLEGGAAFKATVSVSLQVFAGLFGLAGLGG